MKNRIKKCYDNIINKWNSFINIKYIKPLFKFLPQNIFLFILFVISIFTIISFYNANKYKYFYQQVHSSDVVGEIFDKPYDIKFKDYDIELLGNPEQFCLKFAFSGKPKTSDYKYILYKNDEFITDEVFNASKVKDGENYCFDIPGLNKDNVLEYKVSIEPINATKDNSITLYRSAKGVPSMFFIAKEKFLSIRTLIGLIFIIIFLAINYFINKKKIKPEQFWLLISSIYIFIAVFFIPPYQVPDELIHYVNTINLSQIDLTKNLYTQIEEKEITVPEDYGCVAYTSPQKTDKLTDPEEFIDCFRSRDNITKTDWHISLKSKLGYIFTTIAFKIADKFSNSPMVLFYSGRILNTIVSVIMIFLAIKIAPKYKYIILSIASIPMFIQEMISYSYDSLLNSVCIFIVALILNLIYNKDAKLWKNAIMLTICGALISDIKFIYLTIFLFLFLIPNEKFDKKYKKWLYCLLIILIGYAIGKFTRLYVEYDPTGESGLSLELISGTKFNYLNLKEHPLMVFSIAFYTILYQGVFYLRSIFAYFGWFRYRFHDILIFAYSLYMIYLCLSNKRMEGKKYKKIIIFIALLFSLAAIFASMYFGWSRPGLGYVEGVQGRYFLPLILPFMILLLPKKEIFKEDEKINYSFINIMLLQFVLILLFGYY